MIFNAKWQVKPGLSWQSAVSRLVKELEDHGCVLNGEGTLREICIPGLDERVMSHFRGGASAQEGLMTEDWKNFIQRELWSRAEIRLDVETRRVEFQWTYWTSFQIAFHLLMAVLFFGAGCRIEWAWLLFVPSVFALSDALKLNQVFARWHAKCSSLPSAIADR